MPTPAELLAQSLQALRDAKRFSGNNNSYRKDNPGEYAKVIAYLDGGARPTGVTTAMGVHALLEEDVRRGLSIPGGAPYTDIDFSGGKYAGQGVYAIFEAYQSDSRLSDWGGTDAPLYDQWGMSTDTGQRVHLRPLFGRSFASWQELRSTDGPWASNAPTLAKSTLNITREATWGPGGYGVGQERWWAVDYLFPLNIDGVSFEFVNTWHSLFALHPATSSQGGTLDSFIRPEGGNPRWHLLGTTPNPQTTPYKEVQLDRLTNADGSRNAVAYNVWHELVVGMRSASDNSGWLEVWHDGQNVLPRENRPTVLPGETGPYAQLQNYTRYPTSFVGGKTRGAIVYGGFRAGLTRGDVQQQ